MRRAHALIAIFALALSLPALASAGTKQREKIEAAIQVLHEITAKPEESIPPSLLHGARAVAIIPGVVKVGFVIGGRYGSGVLLRHQADGSWSNPAFISLAGGSVGLQVGAQSTDVLLVIKSDKTLDDLGSGRFTLGVDAAIAAGPVGRQAETATGSHAAIYAYSRSRGLFAGVSLQGASLRFDGKANHAFYGPDASVADIFDGRATPESGITKQLRDALSGAATMAAAAR